MNLSSLFGGKKKKLIGLDLGSATIKMAEIDYKEGGESRLISFNFSPTPPASIGAGDISNVGAVAETLQVLKPKTKQKLNQVCIGMWGTSVIIKKITMPRVEKKLISQQIKWEAEQYIPFDPSEISLTYNLLKGPPNTETMDVLLVAAQNAIISQFVNVAANAGLEISVLDVVGLALANCFEMNYGKTLGKTIALINIGANVTNFVVLHNSDVIFSRDIPYGGMNYTLEIHKELGVTIPEAEALKLSAVTGEDVPDRVHQISSLIISNAIEELRTSFDYFMASVPGYTIEKCYYTGGASGTPGLIDSVSQALGVPFEFINPFLKVKPPAGMTPEYLHQLAPFAAIAIGLATRQVGDG